MAAGPPSRIDLEHDDHHATHVGRVEDGRQFFITMPFEPEHAGQPRRDFLALYLWAADGKFLEARVSLAPPEWDDVEEAVEALVDELGDVEFCRIRVAPFSVRLFDLDFGLIPRPPESDDDEWAVELMPGNSMCFFAPWDSGEYDT